MSGILAICTPMSIFADAFDAGEETTDDICFQEFIDSYVYETDDSGNASYENGSSDGKVSDPHEAFLRDIERQK